MLGRGCGISQYSQFYEKQFENINCYHVHIWKVLRSIMDKNDRRKNLLELAGEAETFSGRVLEKCQQTNT